MNRRGLILAGIGLLVTPPIVRAESLMKISPLPKSISLRFGEYIITIPEPGFIRHSVDDTTHIIYMDRVMRTGIWDTINGRVIIPDDSPSFDFPTVRWKDSR